MKVLLRLCLIGALLLPFRPLVSASYAQEINLLQNPGFENPYSQQCCHTEPGQSGPYAEIAVAQGWLAWWVEPESSPAFPAYCDYNYAPPSCQPYHRPEYGMAFPYPERIRSGGNAQKYFTFYSTHLAGLYQQVNGVAPGQAYRFSVYIQTWSTNVDKGFTSAGQPSMGVQVGIDPTGETNPFSDKIVWSQAQNAFDVWTQLSVEAIAMSPTLTVYTRSWPQLALQHNDVYLDDASLSPSSGSTLPLPTDLPFPTVSGPLPGITTGPTVAPFFTSTPNPNNEIWYIVQSGDTLGGIAYRHDTTVDEIKQQNNLNSNTIYLNQKLLIKTVTPAPTATDALLPTSTPTLQIVSPPTNTPMPVVASLNYGQLCVVAYNDANRNAVNDDETGAPDVRVTLSVGATPLDGYVTTSDEISHCFPQLPAGAYTVSVAAPAGYTPTTASEATVQLQSGSLVTLAFGLTAVTTAPLSESPISAIGGPTMLVLGLAGVVLILMVVGAAAFLLARKK